MGTMPVLRLLDLLARLSTVKGQAAVQMPFGVPGAAAAYASMGEAPLPHAEPVVAQSGVAWLAWRRMHALVLSSVILAAFAQRYDECVALLYSIPRTLRTVAWAVQAGWSYKRLMRAHFDHEADEYQEALSELHTYWAQKLLQVCRLNGGIYVKAGQIAAMFAAVPHEYRSVLAQLEDRARPRPYKAVRKMLAQELGPGFDSLFVEFDHKATAAASLAQVHKARLSTGEEVAVKVQYPGLSSAVGSDLGTMRLISGLTGLFFPAFRLGWLYAELERKLEVELDFRNELQNADRLRTIVKDDPRVALPKIYTAMSSARIITMEWIHGCKVTDLETLQAQNINPRAVGRELVKLFAECMFIHGYVHGDPHPGNVMVRKRGRPNLISWLFGGSKQPFEIVLLDHGTYVTIHDELRQQFCALFCSLLTGDREVQAATAREMGGEAAERTLPLLLTQRVRSKADERAIRQQIGAQRPADITQMLANAPPELVDVLRVHTVIRSTSNVLGCVMAERLRMFGSIAKKGLPSRKEVGVHLHRNFSSLLYRLKLELTICAIIAWSSTQSLAVTTWDLIIGVFGEALFN